MGVPVTHSEGSHLLGILLTRRDLIQCLRRGPHSKPELVEACQVSRSTVDRGIGTLEDSGVVEREGRYKLSLFGSIVASEFQRGYERMDSLVRIREFLQDLDGAAVDAALFDEADIAATDGIGIGPLLEILDGATAVRFVDPPFALVALGLAGEGATIPSATVSVLIRSVVLEEVREFNPSLMAGFADNDVEIRKYDGSFPFSFALVERDGETSLCLVLWSEQRGMALVETINPAALAWGEARYEEALATCNPVVPERANR